MFDNMADDDSNLPDSDDHQEADEESLEEVEPKLKYDRLSNDLTRILSKDAASCMAVHSKFLALGTHCGMIHILDHAGNNIRSKDINAHKTTVNQITIDDTGDYIASCSDDGQIVITGLYTNENNQAVNFDRPIKAIAINPEFSRSGSGKHYVSGDDKLVIGEKGFLGRYKTHIVHEGEGPIRSIKWKSCFIAWSNDKGVKIYDMSLRCRITNITKEHSYRPDLYQCNLCWKDNRTLLLGWADKVKICVVKDKTRENEPNTPSRYVEITAMFTTDTDCYICGVAPLGNNLVVLTYDKEGQKTEGGKFTADRPHLQIWEPHRDYYEEISDDALSFRGFEEYRCFDYHLECVIEESLFFLISPKDVVVAKLRDQDDHISWLLEHNMYEEAMTAAMQHSRELKKHSFQELGKQYLENLLEGKEYKEAAQLCVKILGRSKEMWEEVFEKFNSIKELKALAPYLPRGNPVLSPAIYEMVLNEFLQTDHKGLLCLIKEWPHSLYNIQAIINILLDELEQDQNNKILLECLGELYTNQKRFDKALAIYLRLQHNDVFTLIDEHNLYDAVNDKIIQLMQFDRDQAVILLLDNIDKVPIKKVVQQLEKTPELLHCYLDKLFQKDPHLGLEYHPMQVKLYAEYDRPKLLPFLKNSIHCPLQMALEECQLRNFMPEQVFLYGKIGDTKRALKVIMEKLKDVQQAIDFCKEQNDKDLWEDLITYSIDQPNFITGLLQNIGTHVDPIILIQRIREGMKIPKLRDSLVKILQDYQLQIALREGCRKILEADSIALLKRLQRTQKRGLVVNENQCCTFCQQRLIDSDFRSAKDIVVFFCHHAFHQDCMEANGTESCMICNTQRRGPGVSSLFKM